MKTSQIHQLHHKQWVCALPRRRPADGVPPGGRIGDLHQGGVQSGRGQTSQHS